jgi:hypothetical protein
LLICNFMMNVNAQDFTHILIQKDAHPAMRSAAEILANKLHIPEANILEKNKLSVPTDGTIELTYGKPSKLQLSFIGQDPQKVEFDGYLIKFEGNKALIFGKRPRSLLYAAGDLHWWKDRRSGIYVRQPDFKIRDINKGSENNMAQLIANTGANIVFDNIHPEFITLQKSFPQIFNSIPQNEQEKLLRKREEAQQQALQLTKACHDADVDFYPFLYGNDIVRWSPVLAKAVYKVYPDIEGVRAPHSWEKATLNPSLPITWKIIDAIVDEYIHTLHGDGMVATFWDDYGIYSQDSLSRSNGMNHFDEELQKIVGEYDKVLSKYHKPLIMRTWSSGRAHWVTLKNNQGQLEHQFVHAPGYGGFSGSRRTLWGKVIDSLPKDIILQTKSYMSDCFPAARNNTLIGNAGNHPQIIEYQITGQTTGLFYLPAVNVEYTDSTIKRAWQLIGKNGGTNVFYGGTHQPHYNLFDDIANSINLFAWKELSWNVNTNIQQIWQAWAEPIYGKKAAPYIIKALQLSEPVANEIFSTLGFGWDTNSGFPGTIYRREVLLMYTNRFYLPEYSRFLIPNKENIQLVLNEKNDALEKIDSMFSFLEKAKLFLSASNYNELYTRFNWLKYIAIENKELEVSYWRYLYSMRTTDTTEMNAIVASMKKVEYYRDSLFTFDPSLQLSSYGLPAEQINRLRHIGLGNPLPLMKEIYTESKQYEEEIIGPGE